MAKYDKQVKVNKRTKEAPTDAVNSMLDLFSVPAGSNNESLMTIYVIDFCRKNNIPYYIDQNNNIICDKGAGLKPTFCAHIDTVHYYENGYMVYLDNDKIRAHDNDNFFVGCGGDDKAGIWVCLQVLLKLDNVLCVFFSSEESGGEGSNNIDTTIFDNSKFVIGIDRYGNSDIINNYCGDKTTSQEFETDIKPIRKIFGYKYNSGYFTDALNLFSRGIGIVCVNISCGYYEHHSDTENVDVNELYTCYLLCLHFAGLTERYEHKRTIRKAKTKYIGSSFETCGCILSANEYYECKKCKLKEWHVCDYCGNLLVTFDETANKACNSCYNLILQSM